MRLLPAAVVMMAIAAEHAAHGRWVSAVAFAIPAFALAALAARARGRR